MTGKGKIGRQDFCMALGKERRRRLAELAKQCETSQSELVRRLIDAACDCTFGERKKGTPPAGPENLGLLPK